MDLFYHMLPKISSQICTLQGGFNRAREREVISYTLAIEMCECGPHHAPGNVWNVALLTLTQLILYRRILARQN